jgi:hypothetical protein
MNYARLIFDDTPAFIPVPAHLQHRRVEAILLPLDDEYVAPSGSPDTQPENPESLASLIGKERGCFKNAEEIAAFIRSERNAWEDSEQVTPRPIGLAKDRGVPVPDSFFEPLPDDVLASFNGES